MKVRAFLLVLTLDSIICILFDSIHCQKDYFTIFYALFLQICIYLLYIESDLISDIDFIMRWRNVPVLIIILIGSFGILINGNLGANSPKTNNCPNTWLLYLGKL